MSMCVKGAATFQINEHSQDRRRGVVSNGLAISVHSHGRLYPLRGDRHAMKFSECLATLQECGL